VLAAEEEWPYMPHLTVVKMADEEQAQRAHIVARDRWAQYHGGRYVRVEKLTFVREQEQNCWVDLAGIPLGRSLVSPNPR
jgi:hypothetical protein